MQKGNRDGKRGLLMEMEMEPVSKIQVVQVSQKTKDEAQRNLDEICQFEDEKSFHGDLDFGIKVGVLPAFLHNDERRYRKQDLSYNFSVIYFLSWIKMCPFGVDLSSRNYPRVRVGYNNLWKNMICYGWFFLALIRLFSLILATVYFVLTEDAEEELGRMTLMICLSTCITLLIYCVMNFMLSTIHIVPLANSVFKYLDDEPKPKLVQMKTNSAKNGLWKLRFGFGSHTLKELLMIHLPFLVFPISGINPLMSIVDPSFPLLLVSLLPPESRFSLVFFCVVLVDSILFTYYAITCLLTFHVFFGIHRIQEEARLTVKHLSMTMTTEQKSPGEQENLERINILKTLKSLRLVHIWAQFLNLSYSSFVYSCKLIALSASILGGFGWIKMMEVENWPYAGVFGLLFFEGNILYNVFFGGAYKIPEKVAELKREIRQLSYKMKSKGPNPNQNGNQTREEIKYMEKCLRSIPWLGVKDGVYKMERLTCPNFLQFVVQQITSLVLSY